jgi:hypothetical protein
MGIPLRALLAANLPTRFSIWADPALTGIFFCAGRISLRSNRDSFLL